MNNCITILGERCEKVNIILIIDCSGFWKNARFIMIFEKVAGLNINTVGVYFITEDNRSVTYFYIIFFYIFCPNNLVINWEFGIIQIFRGILSKNDSVCGQYNRKKSNKSNSARKKRDVWAKLEEFSK